MQDVKQTIVELKLAELQFRLAVTVRLATSLGTQPLEVQTSWSHGKHVVTYEEIVLTKDQADISADHLKRTATYLMSLTIKEALQRTYGDPKTHSNQDVVAAYQISRLIRNAFAHSPVNPAWNILPECRQKIFTIKDVISLDTTDLHRKPFDWRHYGGLLALFRLSKFVRIGLLGDMDTGTNRSIPKPQKKIYQQGDLILAQIDKLPSDLKLSPTGNIIRCSDE